MSICLTCPIRKFNRIGFSNCCLNNKIFLQHQFFLIIHVFVVNKISTSSNVDCKNNTTYSVEELHLFLCLFSSSAEVILASFISLTFPVHSSTNLSTIFSTLTYFVIKILTNITPFVTFTLVIARIPNESFIAYTFIN